MNASLPMRMPSVSAKKFIDERYEEDKQKIIEKYNELGYRDAQIEVDSVSPYD